MFTFAADQWNIHKYCRNHKIFSSFGYIHVTTAWGKCSETRNWNTKYPLEVIEKWASMAGDYVKKTPTSEEFAFVRCFFFLYSPTDKSLASLAHVNYAGGLPRRAPPRIGVKMWAVATTQRPWLSPRSWYDLYNIWFMASPLSRLLAIFGDSRTELIS